MNNNIQQINLWNKIEGCFRFYELRCSPASLIFMGHIGLYLLIRFAMLCTFFVLISNKLSVLNMLYVIFSVYLLLDILISNTSIAFVTKNPINNLRSFLFTFFTFIQVVVIYGIFYKFLQHQFAENMCNWQFLYFSIVTITTLGYGDFVPEKWGTLAQIIVTMELLTGFFFIVGVFARIIGLKEKTTKKAGKKSFASRPPKVRRLA